MIQTKTCTQCETPKELTAFNLDKTRPDGRFPWCKECKYRKEAAERLANPGRNAQQCKEWRNANLAKARQIDKDRYAKRDRKVLNATKSRWGKRNKVKRLIEVRARQAKKKQALCECCQTPEAKADFELAYALARKLKMHVDHVRPLAKGGLHCINNLQLLTPLENMRKGAKWQEAA